jgi:hypothetical protein
LKVSNQTRPLANRQVDENNTSDSNYQIISLIIKIVFFLICIVLLIATIIYFKIYIRRKVSKIATKLNSQSSQTVENIEMNSIRLNNDLMILS